MRKDNTVRILMPVRVNGQHANRKPENIIGWAQDHADAVLQGFMKHLGRDMDNCEAKLVLVLLKVDQRSVIVFDLFSKNAGKITRNVSGKQNWRPVHKVRRMGRMLFICRREREDTKIFDLLRQMRHCSPDQLPLFADLQAAPKLESGTIYVDSDGEVVTTHLNKEKIDTNTETEEEEY
jgi:hypothetical protein